MEGIFITELDPGDGIRLAVKDLFDTAGLRTTYGSAVFADHVPDRTSEAVRRLEAAGYASVGKTNLHEFAYGVTSQNLHYGTVPNPVAPGRTAGGSSGGSAAALAAGLADAALGTDSGGSIRIPAACCAIAGFKPSFGLVPIDGVFPLAPSFDHAGPMARDVAGCVEQMRALAPELEVPEVALGDVRVAVAWTELAEPLVHARVEAAAAFFREVPRIGFPEPVGTTPAFMREIADVHRELYAEQGELYGENVRPKIELCLDVTDADAAAAAHARACYAAQALEALDGFDLLLTPTLAFVPPPADVDEIAARTSIVRFTYPFNALGWPALALPCGAAEYGLSASAQLVGRRGDDALVLAAGLALERLLAPTVSDTCQRPGLEKPPVYRVSRPDAGDAA
jgi:aspartyl-tRNA(Asn)/glutamyl-tRNA(Gln) amidotransferase subunit A